MSKKIFGLIFFLPAFAWAFVHPVIDETGFFTVHEKTLITNQLEDLRDQYGIWMVVQTTAVLPAEVIESYAEQKFQDLQVGEAGVDNGLLLVIAPKSRDMRLEVGYGLEGTLTDVVSRRLLDEILRPAFRAHRNAAGVVDLIGKIKGIARGSEKEWLAQTPHTPDTTMPFMTRLIAMVLASSGIISLAVLEEKKQNLKTLEKIMAAAPELTAQPLAQDISRAARRSVVIFLALNFILCVLIHRFVPPVKVTFLEVFVGVVFGLFMSAVSASLALYGFKRTLRKIDQQVDNQLSPEALHQARDIRTTVRIKNKRSFKGSSKRSSSGGSMGGGGRSGGGGASSNW